MPPLPRAWVQSLTGELRSHKLQGKAQPKKKKMGELKIRFNTFSHSTFAHSGSVQTPGKQIYRVHLCA